MVFSVMNALSHLFLNGFDHRRMAVAEEECAVTDGVIDVFIAVDIPFVRSFGPDDVGPVGVKNPEDMGGSIPGKKVDRSLVDALGFLMGTNVCFEQWVVIYNNLLMSLK
jgi:hypothetical protein